MGQPITGPEYLAGGPDLLCSGQGQSRIRVRKGQGQGQGQAVRSRESERVEAREQSSTLPCPYRTRLLCTQLHWLAAFGYSASLFGGLVCAGSMQPRATSPVPDQLAAGCETGIESPTATRLWEKEETRHALVGLQ